MQAASETTFPETPAERTVVFLSLVLIVLPPFLFSSLEYRYWPLLAALVLLAGLTRCAFPSGPALWEAKGFILCFGIAHAASWWGGWSRGDSFGTATRLALEGIVGVLGLAVLASTLLRPRWRKFLQWLGLLLVVPLLAASLLIYFLPVGSLTTPAATGSFFGPTRLLLVWPTRFLMTWAGQIGWEHANHAGLLFAVALVLTFESLAGTARDRKPRLRWLLAVALGVAIFLTGSRSALLMIAASMPFLLFRRPFGWIGKCFLSIGLSLLLGMLCLEAREDRVRQVDPSVPANNVHTSGLVKRGSAGRLGAYRVLWNDLEGARMSGKGLSSAGTPLAHLNHEHSSYLATFRGGGLIALAAHLSLLFFSLLAAARLYAAGLRWPLPLLIAVLAGLLFDRGNVFAVSGRYEFLLHWTSVLLPLLLAARATTVRPCA